MSRLEVDNFEGSHSAISWKTSTINEPVDDGNTLPIDPEENTMVLLDNKSPHDTAGCLLRWDGTSDLLRFELGTPRNVENFAAISVRISQKVDSTVNPAGAQDLYFALKDQSGNSRDIKVSKFVEIPAPHVRANNDLTKSAMNSVRIPLHAYTIKAAGVSSVNLQQVTEVALKFAAEITGEIEIDSVEFTK